MQQNKKKKDTASHLNMEVKRGQLTINNQMYKKKVTAPKFGELLQLDPEELVKAQTATLVRTADYREKDNVFIGYGCEVSNASGIRAIYKHLKIKHANATSVTLAYNLAGTMPDLQDYDDDGEIGCGVKLLDQLKLQKMQNMAIYLVRYHSAKNLGVRRY